MVHNKRMLFTIEYATNSSKMFRNIENDSKIHGNDLDVW